MAPQKAPLHSMVHWVKKCANDCHNLPPKSFLAVENPLEFHFGMKDMDSLSMTKDYSMNIQLVFLEVRWTLDLHHGKLVH